MNEAEYIALKTVKDTGQSVSISELTNLDNRTLLYGYNCNRDTWHVYLFARQIFLHFYSESWERDIDTYEVKVTWPNASALVPNKRLYPECCDFEFCQLLKQKGVYLPFTTFKEREREQFYGKI